jgi:hypothetical protein
VVPISVNRVLSHVSQSHNEKGNGKHVISLDCLDEGIQHGTMTYAFGFMLLSWLKDSAR